MDISRLIRQAGSGDEEARDALYRSVYDELHRIAELHRNRWKGNDTLNTTALIHEAWIKLARDPSPPWVDRRHFFAVASRAMRQILVDYAERSHAAKRGGRAGASRIPVEMLPAAPPEAMEDLLTLNNALIAMEEEHPRWVRIVECRFFSGLTIEETAEALETSSATVKREWRQARAWLGRVLAADDAASP